MIIFIRKIPVNTYPSDLHDFVSPALRMSFLRQSGYIVKAEILILEDKLNRTLEFHGLVHVNSDVAGHRAIKKLTGKLLKGKRVIVREYHAHRNWRNDKRHSNTMTKAPVVDLRKTDRRRGNNLQRITDFSLHRAYAAIHKDHPLCYPLHIENIEIPA